MTHDRPHGGTDTLFEDLERELSSEPSRGGRPEADSDPLAELARLIEQNRGPASAPRMQPAAAPQPQPAAAQQGQRPQSSQAARPQAAPRRHEDELAAELEASLRDMDFSSEGDPFAQPGDVSADIVSAPSASRQQARPQPQPAPAATQTGLPGTEAPADDDPFASLENSLKRATDAVHSAAQGDRAQAYASAIGKPHLASDPYAHDPAYAAAGEPGIHYEDGAPEFEEDEQGSPYGDEDYEYDEAPRSKRGVFIVGVLLGLVLVGGAAAYGFKSFFSDDADIPVVRAQQEPAKSMPEPSGQDAQQQGKLVYDRIGGTNDDPASNQIVPREEQVAIGTDGRPIRVISGEGAPPAPSAGAEGEDDLKRVRTLTVRPDGQIETPPPAPEPAPMPQPVQAQPEPANSTIALAPQPVAPSPVATNSGGNQPASQLDVVRQNAQREAQQQGVPLPLTRPAPAVGGQAQTPVAVAPIQIPAAPTALQPAPQPLTNSVRVSGRGTDDAAAIVIGQAPRQPQPVIQAQPQPQPSLPVAVAPAPAPTAQPRATQQIAAAPATSGGYVIQVASSPSQSDAESAISRVQGRAGGVVGRYQPQVQRADLGTRGVFYRAAFGPVANKNEAINACNQLKSRGIDCFVRN
ncbi:MAG: SPOR domain-containing protein [Rhodobiaceae bacterium]|nr:SPOR domain-containing protein [Rhodobiaceae bacterium]